MHATLNHLDVSKNMHHLLHYVALPSVDIAQSCIKVNQLGLEAIAAKACSAHAALTRCVGTGRSSDGT